MNKKNTIIIIGLISLIAVIYYFKHVNPALSKEQRNGQPDVYNVNKTDNDMNQAIETAQKTLPAFIETFLHPKDGQVNFIIKVRFKEGSQVEHMWVNQLEYKNGYFTGKLSNKPVYLNNLKIGDFVKINANDVSDWMFFDGSKLKGGYTMKVLRNRMNDEEKQKFDNEFGYEIE